MGVPQRNPVLGDSKKNMIDSDFFFLSLFTYLDVAYHMFELAS